MGKPYTLHGQPNEQMVEALDQMLEELYRLVGATTPVQTTVMPLAPALVMLGIDGDEGEEGQRGGPGSAGATGATGPSTLGPPGQDGQDGDDNSIQRPAVRPGGLTTHVQFNDDGAFAGDAGLTYAKATDALTLAGQLVISGAAAGQIVFPAAQNASSNANTIDDYEEGTWTPVLGGTGGTTGQAYSRQAGQYIKIGQLVLASYTVILSTEGTITGNVQVSGLPFTVGSDAGGFVTDCAVCRYNSLVTTWSHLFVTPIVAATTALLQGATVPTTGNVTALTALDVNDTTELRGSILYRAAA